MELKTLKDFETKETYLDKALHIKQLRVINSEDLRQEAIKWIKIKQSRHTDLDSSSDIIGYEAIVSWIKYFFNIE